MAKTNREMSESTDTQHSIGKVVTSTKAAVLFGRQLFVLMLEEMDKYD